jgi:8-oxo-dGTP pyrophosphatase MutT (NUDIX family)
VTGARGGEPDGAARYPRWREWPMIRAWEGALASRRWNVESLRPLNVLPRLNGEPLFALLEVRGSDPEARPILPYVLVRGEAALVVPACANRATGERKLLMVRQWRVGDGTKSLEFPAGMVENGSSPLDTARRELQEETGLSEDVLAGVVLEPLWDKALTTTPGLSDEAVHFYTVTLTLDDEVFRALDGGAAGHEAEGEHIVTVLKTPAEAAAEQGSVLTLLALLLWQRRAAAAASLPEPVPNL